MFWERFYELCLNLGTRPNPVGKELGISSGVITKWKNGSVPNGDTLAKIADYLNCSVDYLLGRTNNPTPVNDNSPIASVIGENGVREDRHRGSESNKDRVALLEEMGIINSTNYIMSKDNVKTELNDNEYDFLINTLGFYRKK